MKKLGILTFVIFALLRPFNLQANSLEYARWSFYIGQFVINYPEKISDQLGLYSDIVALPDVYLNPLNESALNEINEILDNNPDTRFLANFQCNQIQEELYRELARDNPFMHEFWLGIDNNMWMYAVDGRRIFYSQQFPMLDIIQPRVRKYIVDKIHEYFQLPKIQALGVKGIFLDVVTDYILFLASQGHFQYPFQFKFTDAEYKSAIHGLVRELRERMGTDFIILANGQNTTYEVGADGQLDEDIFRRPQLSGDKSVEATLKWMLHWEAQLNLLGKSGVGINSMRAHLDSANVITPGVNPLSQRLRYTWAGAALTGSSYSFQRDGGSQNDPPLFEPDYLGVSIGTPVSDLMFLPDSIFVREFTKGLVVLNDNVDSATVDLSQFSGAYRRLAGTQDPLTNNGQLAQGVIQINGKDALLLERLEDFPQQPGEFARLTPVDSTMLANQDSVIFSWRNSVDPNGDSVSYELKWNILNVGDVITLPDTSVKLNLKRFGITHGVYDVTWEVFALDGKGGRTPASNGKGIFTIDFVTGVNNEDDLEIPNSFSLAQNYPNPFNPTTEIRYVVGQPGLVSIKIFNMRGQEVLTLVNAVHAMGEHVVTWDGRDQSGNPVSSGVYIYSMIGSGFVQTKKLSLLR